MLCISSYSEESFVTGITNGQEAWLGFTDTSSEGSFEWYDGCNSTYTNWNGGEPNDWGGGEDYSLMNWDGSGGWNDITGGYFLCMCQTTTGPPAAPTMTSAPTMTPAPTLGLLDPV